jgi:serine/threonine-protein kinase
VEGVQVLGGRYRIVERLGMGGMSMVWRAYDEVLGRQVAVKVLTPRYATDAESRERIRTEAQSAARLSHPHITNVYDYGEHEAFDGARVPFVVMELLSGRTLAERLAKGPLPWRVAMRIGAEVAAALAAAHARGLVHRDVKPANVMLTTTGAKVLDFGIAAIAGERVEPGPDGTVLGTPAYLAPERMAGGPVQPATDVYALGLLLYRMLTGVLPWHAETTTEMISANCYAEPQPLPPIDGLPQAVTELCARCLVKKPEDRPSSREIAVVLAATAGVRLPLGENYQVGDEEAADEPTVAHAVPGRRPRWRLRVVQIGLAAVAAGATALLVTTCTGVDRSAKTSQAAAADRGAPAAANAAACAVRYETRSDANGAFTVDVTIRNSGQHALKGWSLAFTLDGDQRLVQGWSADWQQQGHTITAGDSGVNADLASGATTTVRFAGSYRQANPLPVKFTLNDQECSYSVIGANGETRTGGPGGGGIPAGGDVPGGSTSTPGGDPGGGVPPTTGGGAEPTPSPPDVQPTATGGPPKPSPTDGGGHHSKPPKPTRASTR